MMWNPLTLAIRQLTSEQFESCLYGLARSATASPIRNNLTWTESDYARGMYLKSYLAFLCLGGLVLGIIRPEELLQRVFTMSYKHQQNLPIYP